MSALDAFNSRYSKEFRKSLDPSVLALMEDAFIAAWDMGSVDAQRWRFVVDEAIQDSLVAPVGIAVAMLSFELNSVGNRDIVGWGVTYECDAEDLVDRMMVDWSKSA